MIPAAGLATAVALLASAAPAAPSPAVLDLDISNFRYCRAAPCLPTDQGYVRSVDGPFAGTDNPGAIIDVPAGALVRWTYRDDFCDAFEMCPGHEVMIENGTAEGRSIGFAKSRQGETTITYLVTEPAGTLIRYFCHVNNHDVLGQTAILRVV
ncbi:MAG TPA: hypothetical protein VMZ00_18195 [Sporichthya sp.]|nr:hypothetical protein [Sporichthya sp.]